MIGTLDKLSYRIPSIKVPIPSIHNRGMLCFVSFALIIELYSLPDPLSVFAIAGFRGIGAGRLVFILSLFYFARLFRYQPLSLSFPGRNILILFFCAAFLSFIVNGLDSSFEYLLQSNSYLEITSLIKGVGFLIIFIVFFSKHEALILFFKVVLICSSLVILSFLIGIDKGLLAYLGKVPALNSNVTIYELLFTRPTFGTMNGNTFSGIVVGVMLIALYCTLRSTKRTYFFLYAFCVGLCILAIIKGASRGVSVMALSGVAILILASTTDASFKNKSASVNGVLILTFMIIFVGYLFHRGTIFVLWERWSEIVTNIGLKSFGFIQTYSAYDNFTVRILLAIDALPNGAMEWLFGTGGVTKGYSYLFRSNCHTDLINLLGQYGLTAFVPYVGYLVRLFFYLLKTRLSSVDPRLSTLRALGLTLIVVFLLESLFSPLFFSRWFWMGIITSIAIIIKDAEKIRRSSRNGISESKVPWSN